MVFTRLRRGGNSRKISRRAPNNVFIETIKHERKTIITLRPRGLRRPGKVNVSREYFRVWVGGGNNNNRTSRARCNLRIAYVARPKDESNREIVFFSFFGIRSRTVVEMLSGRRVLFVTALVNRTHDKTRRFSGTNEILIFMSSK